MTDLRRFFGGVAWKRLAAVETDPVSSNQHELNGVARLKSLLGIFGQQFQNYIGQRAGNIAVDLVERLGLASDMAVDQL